MFVKAPNGKGSRKMLLDTFAGSIWVDVDRYHGQWIAIREDRVVGSDRDLEELMKDTEMNYGEAEYQYVTFRREGPGRK